MGCLGYMVTKKYVMGCLPDTSSMGVCDGMPRIYGYKRICDGMPRIYGYKEVCDGIETNCEQFTDLQNAIKV